MAWEGQQAVREEQGSPTEKLTLLEGGGNGGWKGRRGGVTGEGIKRWGIEGIRFGTSDRFSAGAEANYSALSHYARET